MRSFVQARLGNDLSLDDGNDGYEKVKPRRAKIVKPTAVTKVCARWGLWLHDELAIP